MRAAILLLAALGLGACLRQPDPIELDLDAVTVHAILEAGADSAVLLLARSSLEPFRGDFRPVTGAEVRLFRGGDTTWLVPRAGEPCVDGFGVPSDQAEGEGCYRARLDAPIEPGGVYGLEILLADGTRVTGEAAVPVGAEIVRPAPDTAITARCHSPESCFDYDPSTEEFARIATVRVGWDPPQGAATIEVGLTATATYLGGTEYGAGACQLNFHEARVFADSAVVPIDYIICSGENELDPARFDSIRAAVSVSAWSPEYVRFLDAMSGGQTIRSARASEGLDGAYGMFAAVAVTRRSIVLVRDPPPAAPTAAAAAPEP